MMPIDYSDRIAYMQVCLEILSQFDPAGKWSEHQLLNKWHENHYAVTRRELALLEEFLDQERERVTQTIEVVARGA
ncbi:MULTISPECIES: hypothetical protein [Leptolyngbya]|uniref:hypothetical protein n=1 Tax=Leptolyngbya TaxID=47251 RepID=UPI001685B80A|nr:hypothetical protein [Leptolyngbya sp. FACHB-1624]MBD1857970.1 hypothetical protein [Leptolyngbya sp. FACHB-1624]